MPPEAREPAAIRPLDELTISRIAAGEVVERPASVVKELVENSLDAGARAVRIEVHAGGKRSIRVVDDGCGIPRDQVESALARHATSKLRADVDLEHVATLGFRGEALAAIASVAHVTLVSRARSASEGTRVRIDAGRTVSVEQIGAPYGTSVTVENLFHATPARRKFLQGDAAEAARIGRIATRYALAHPDRKITFVRNDRTVLRTAGDGDGRAVLAAVFDASVAADMLSVAHSQQPDEEGYAVGVSGFVSPPHLHRANRLGITIFVNGRWIQDARLSYAITEAYQGRIPARRFPIAVIMLDVPPEVVDVNVHPAKTEVRFRDHGWIFRAVQHAVRAAVGGQAPVAPLRDPRPGGRGTPWAPWPGHAPTGRVRDRSDAVWIEGHRSVADETGSPAGNEAANDDGPRASEYGSSPERDAHGGPAPPSLPRQSGAPRSALPPLRVLGQIALSFVAAEGPEGLYLVDQHAAHERIMYERFLARAGPPASQRLLVPLVLAVDGDLLAVVEQHGARLASLGFEMEEFGPGELLVRAVPEVVAGPDAEATVRGALEAMAEGDDPVERAFDERLVRAVCKGATIKAGHRLSTEEMRVLLRDLERAEDPFSCPHGRPTMIVLSVDALAARFGRS